MLRVDASGELLEERNLDLLELDGLDDVENLLDLIEKHDLLRRVDLGPVPKETQKNLLGEHGILLEELDDTVGELGVVKSERLGLVERDEDPGKECLVLLLERERETIDDGSEDLEQFCNAVVALRLVDELEEDVVDRPADEGPEVEELAVDPVERRLEKVALSGVLAVKELKELRRLGGRGRGERGGRGRGECNGSAHAAAMFEGKREGALTCKTNPWSMYFLAVLVLKSGLSTNRRKNS